MLRKIQKGIENPHNILPYFLEKVGKRANYGRNIYEYDEWDIVIILDACRYDLFEDFAPKHGIYDEFESIRPIYSCASTTQEWLDKTFTQSNDDVIGDTYYISCTAFTEKMGLDMSRFAGYDEVWRYAISSEYEQTKPEAITNSAIQAFRQSDADRFVIHYAQPHAPFIHCPGKWPCLDA